MFRSSNRGHARRKSHPREHPEWHADQRAEGRGWGRDFPGTYGPAARDLAHVEAHLRQQAEAARAEGRDPPQVMFLPGLSWPV